MLLHGLRALAWTCHGTVLVSDSLMYIDERPAAYAGGMAACGAVTVCAKGFPGLLIRLFMPDCLTGRFLSEGPIPRIEDELCKGL